ncbi:MAG: dTDP-4-dehydrorhamnose reductase, partial [Bacteroidales bacterium]|nr:dTDP-4-dehydrorhamnose reductase [Bacteroidales bacterium]
MKNKVLVFGAQGQLGKCIQDLKKNSNTNWVYADLSEVDITQHSETEKYITSINPNIIINCSAYTAVDNAEIEKNLAYKVNALAVENLAKLSKQIQAKFIHISTDYVFDGRKNTPYTEDEKTNPLNVYGASKLEGEILANKVNSDIAIIRTSWLYSEYGKNFAKTMLNLGKEKEEIKVIFDQTGTPCYAGDLAKAILKITDLY